ncbi:chitin deacetylase-like 5 isoform X2 [Oratosquilla oratoria]|uniref:chitin deacetylase-like 5 isoform X2 n=1 Tax=Oratosquilla oratoria TaxID=337810 RepID=UPI003F76A078
MGWTSFLLLLCLIGTGISQRAGRRRGRFPAGKPEVVDFNCPEDFGYYPHASECSLYYVCVFGGALLESCSGGLVYSHELQTCDWPRNVQCTLSGAGTGVSTVRVTDPRTSNTAPLRAATESLTPSVSNFFQQDSRFGFDNSFSSSQNFQSSSKFPVFEGGEEKSVSGRQGRLFQHEEQDSPQSLSPRFPSKSESLLQETAGSNNRPRSASPSSAFRPITFSWLQSLEGKSRTRRDTKTQLRHLTTRQDKDRPQAPYDYDFDRKTGFQELPALEAVPGGPSPPRAENRRPPTPKPTPSSNPSRFSIALGSTTQAPPATVPAVLDPFYGDSFNYTDADYLYYYDEFVYDDYIDVAPATTAKPTVQAESFDREEEIDYSTTEVPEFETYPPFTPTTTPRTIPTTFTNNQTIPPTSHPQTSTTTTAPTTTTTTTTTTTATTTTPRTTSAGTSSVPRLRPVPVRIRVPVQQEQSHQVRISPRNRGGARVSSPSTSSSSFASHTSVSPSSALRSSQVRQSARQTSSSQTSSQRGSTSSSSRPTSSSAFPSSSFLSSSPAATSRRVSSSTPSRGSLTEIFRELTDKDFASIQSSNSQTSRSRINSASSGSQSSQALRKAQQSTSDSRAKSRTSSSRGGTSVSQRTQSQASHQSEVIKTARTSAISIPNSRISSPPLTTSFSSSSSKARSPSSSSRGSSSRTSGQTPKSSPTQGPPRPAGSIPQRPQSLYPRPPVDVKATKCDSKKCLLPDCFCGGKDIPGGIAPQEVPQMVLLTFDDSVNDLNKELYVELFERGRKNPNGCGITATFYVSHEWTDYSQVQNLYADGHEMASHTIQHSFGEQFSTRRWAREVAGQREILSAYGGVKMEDVRGMRAPFLAIGGNKMFKMLYDQNFTYDSSMPVYENNPPSYPYTLDYRMFHDCMIPPCPTKAYPGVWEVPMVMWQDLTGGRCSMGDACTTPSDAEGVYKMIIKNFERHYTTNRAPFGLYYHAAWFTKPHHKEGFLAFLDTITAMDDVYLVTTNTALEWTRNPVPLSQARNYPPFQCDYKDRPPKCNKPKVCNVWHNGGVRYMRTCQQCPETYPWTGRTGVQSPLNEV